LRQAYRDRISRAVPVRFVHLAGDHDTIAARLAARSHRYMPPTLLASQFATLEAPQDAIVVDVRDAIPVQVAKIRAALKV
jgi:gluconate kinase